MQTHVTGPPVLGALRQRALFPLLGNPLFTEAEQLRASHFVHECEDTGRLIRWHANVLAESARRAAAAGLQGSPATQRAILRQLRTPAFRGQHAQQRPLAPTWVPGAPLPDRADRRAGTFDRLAAACFQATPPLTLAHLLTRCQS